MLSRLSSAASLSSCALRTLSTANVRSIQQQGLGVTDVNKGKRSMASSAYPQLPQLAETALVVSRDLSKSVYLNSITCCKLPMNIEHETARYRRCCFHFVTVAEDYQRA